MDRDEEKPLDGVFDDQLEHYGDATIDVSSESDMDLQDIAAGHEGQDPSATLGDEAFPPFQKDTNSKKNIVLPIILGAVLVGGVGFVFAGDQIMSLIYPQDSVVAAQTQKPSVTAVPSAPVSSEPVTQLEPLQNDTVIQQAPVEEVSNDAGMSAEDSLLPISENENDIMPPQPQANDGVVDVDVTDVLMPEDEILEVPELEAEPEQPQEVVSEKQDLIAEILKQSAKDSVSGITLDDKQEDFENQNPELAKMISGKGDMGMGLDASGHPFDPEQFSKNRSTADLIRESVVVRPKIKKMIVVRKNFASSSDRSLAVAAQRALDNKQYNVAHDFYTTILENDPTNTIALMGKAKTLVYMGRNDEALSIYSGIVEREPGNHEAMTNYFGLIGDIDPMTASFELEAMGQKYPKNAEIQGQLGVVYGKMKDAVRAFAAFEKAMTLDPVNPMYPYNGAVLADNMSNTNKAIEYFERTLSLIKHSEKKTALSVEAIEGRLSSLYAN